mmetsp:Transcript_871/g.808  ORF Transcript_871/g.808 Transcript_871/m.808 type:complete len:80 (+) Transcript_871:1-240(+)
MGLIDTVMLQFTWIWLNHLKRRELPMFFWYQYQTLRPTLQLFGTKSYSEATFYNLTDMNMNLQNYKKSEINMKKNAFCI